MTDLGDSIRRAQGKPLRDSLERAAAKQSAVDLGMNWRGDWKQGVTYRAGDAVHHECGGFVARKANSGKQPPGGPWDVLVCKGPKGDKGDHVLARDLHPRGLMADFIALGNIDLKPAAGKPGPLKKLDAYECQRCYAVVTNPARHFHDNHYDHTHQLPMPDTAFTVG